MKTISLLIFALTAMSYGQLVPQTPLQSNLARLSQTTATSVYYAELAAQALNANAWIWSLPDDQLAELLTSLGEQRVNELLALQSAQEQALNAGLQAAGSAVRVTTKPTREFTWDNGTSVVVPLQ